MGRKLDALLGRNFNTSKLRTLAKLAISRIAILKNHHQSRCSHARSDVIGILNLGHQEQALLRVEHVIKEQNILDVFAMLENYCHLLIERVTLLQKSKECPDELKEVTSSLIFASSRCGEFPELQKIRQILTTRFGKEFADGSVDLHNNCGVNPKVIQKLSARRPNLEIRSKVLKEIASEIGITLHSEEDAPVVVEEKQDLIQKQKQKQLEPKNSPNSDGRELINDAHELPAEKIIQDEKFSESMKTRKKYRDAAAAAQDAFESAAYAAAAARAAVELSRSESRDNDPDDYGGSSHRQGNISDSDGSMTHKFQTHRYAALEEIEYSNSRLGFGKVCPIDNLSSEFKGEEWTENNHNTDLKEFEEGKNKAGIERTLSASSSDSGDYILRERELPPNLCQNEPLGNEVVFDRYDNDLGSDSKPTLFMNNYRHTGRYDKVEDEDLFNEDTNMLPYRSPKWILRKSQADPIVCPMEGRSRLESKHFSNFVEPLNMQPSNMGRKMVSAST